MIDTTNATWTEDGKVRIYVDRAVVAEIGVDEANRLARALETCAAAAAEQQTHPFRGVLR